MVHSILLLQILFAWTSAFYKAPGTITIQIGVPELIDYCFTEECQYQLEFCIGSGRSFDDRCLWLPKKTYNGYFSLNSGHLAQEFFKTENVKFSFYFNANFTFWTSSKDLKTVTFRNNLIHYASESGTHRVSLHSEEFISMPLEIDIKCEMGFYPPYQCTKMCFKKPGLYNCDINGNMVCLSGYVFVSSLGKCIKDMCKSNDVLCLNNSTCLNEINAIKCVCQEYYTGSACETWDPCKEHKCKNLGTCLENKLLNNYLCKCKDNFYGKYCENIEDPCKGKQCPENTLCRNNFDEAVCVETTKSRFTGHIRSWFSGMDSTLKPINIFTTRMTDNSDLRSRETLIQHSVQKDFTTVAIIIFLLVFIICCFAVMFWIQLYKYFQRRIKCSKRRRISPVPSIINQHTFKRPEYHLQKWSSMDEGAFSLWRMSHNNEFSTITYISASNTLKKPNHSFDTSLNQDFLTNTRKKLSNTNQPQNSNFKNDKNNSCETSESKLENMADNDENCLIKEISDIQYPGVSFV